MYALQGLISLQVGFRFPFIFRDLPLISHAVLLNANYLPLKEIEKTPKIYLMLWLGRIVTK